MNLEKLNLVELDAQEISKIDGGGWLRALERIGAAIGLYDAISDFRDGWNSVGGHEFEGGFGGGSFTGGGGASGSW